MLMKLMLGSRKDRWSRVKHLHAGVESLERRELMSTGSVSQNGALVTVVPSSAGPNAATVSYQSVKGIEMLDVNLNGADHYYGLAQVGFVYYEGSGFGGSQTFINETALHTVAYGGSGTNSFEGGTGQDQFVGGAGVNVFDAGTGYDILLGGSGMNVFDENSAGTGEIVEVGTQNIVNPASPSSTYLVL